MLTIEKEKESNKSPPKPFNTSRLLQTASNMLHTNPKQTMQICQLFDWGTLQKMQRYTFSTRKRPTIAKGRLVRLENVPQSTTAKFFSHWETSQTKSRFLMRQGRCVPTGRKGKFSELEPAPVRQHMPPRPSLPPHPPPRSSPPELNQL